MGKKLPYFEMSKSNINMVDLLGETLKLPPLQNQKSLHQVMFLSMSTLQVSIG